MNVVLGHDSATIAILRRGHPGLKRGGRPGYSGSALVNRSKYQSCTRGMIHNKFNLISPGYPWPNIALQCRIVA